VFHCPKGEGVASDFHWLPLGSFEDGRAGPSFGFGLSTMTGIIFLMDQMEAHSPSPADRFASTGLKTEHNSLVAKELN